MSLLSSAASADKVGEIQVMADFTYQPELSTSAHTTRTPGNKTPCARTNTHTQHTLNTVIHLNPTNSPDTFRTKARHMLKQPQHLILTSIDSTLWDVNNSLSWTSSQNNTNRPWKTEVIGSRRKERETEGWRKHRDERDRGRKRREQKQAFDFARLIRSVPLRVRDHKDKRGCQTAGRSDSIFLGHRDSVWYSDVSSVSSQCAERRMRLAG